MKKYLFLAATALTLLIQSCGGGKPETTKLEKYDLTFTSVKLSDVPEFQDTKASDTDTEWSNYDFNIGGHARVNVVEINPSVYPNDLATLKTALTADTEFAEVIEEKSLSNGAFGIVYKLKDEDGKTGRKNYIFYFKKGARTFRMIPVFNSELKDLDKQIAAWETLK